MPAVVELAKGAWRIRIYPAIRSLSELKFRATTTSPKGGKTTVYADNQERDAALARRVATLVAEGWQDTSVRPRKASKPAPDLSALDAKFGALAARTIAALARSTSDAQDAKVWRTAIKAYAALKTKAGGDGEEHLVHFFAVDGVALAVAHPVVARRVKASAARRKRWMQQLERT